MDTLNLEFAEGWREVAPRADAPDLLIEEGGRLLHQSSDFGLPFDFGALGPVDCPIAYDKASRTAFRYVSAPSLTRRDYSELRAFDLSTGESRALLRLPLNQWVLWLLEWIDGRTGEQGQLFGLLATDRPSDDRVVIEHRLLALRVGEPQARLRPICRDAYRPLAFSRERRELIFAGAEGLYLVNLQGVRSATFPDKDATGHGAAFDPRGARRAVVGGDGLFLWDLAANRSERLSNLGRYPVWASNQDGFWYRESSSDLHYFDLAKRVSSKIFEVAGNRNPELWYARPVMQTRCGRYLGLSVTAKQLRGVSRKANTTGSRERVYAHDQSICILDLERREYWQRGGFANHITWAE
jgi:hypothetical protein